MSPPTYETVPTQIDTLIIRSDWFAALKLHRQMYGTRWTDSYVAIIQRYRFLQSEHPELFAEEQARWEAARQESWILFEPVRHHVHAVVVIHNSETDFPGPTWVEVIASPEGEYVTLRLPLVPNNKYAEKLAAELAESAKVTVTSRFLPIS